MKTGGVSLKKELTYTERRKEVARLYKMGWNQMRLAEHFEVNQSTISRDLEAIRAEWVEQTIGDFNVVKAEQLAKIDALEYEYWNAWRKSKKDRTVKTAKQKVGTEIEKSARVEDREGDPRYLAGIQWCIQERNKIFGVYAAAKVDVTSDGRALEAPRIYLPALEHVNGNS